MKQPEFLKKPLDQMTKEEWESICDGCGVCCQIRVQDIETDEIATSNVACRYLCLNSHKCGDYENRTTNVPDCVKVTPENANKLTWMPTTCAYRLVANGIPLPSWHHLICGDRDEVHKTGPSMMGELISEDDADWQQHL